MPYDIIIGRDDADKKRFLDKGLIFLGKGYVTMGNYTSLSNLIWMDIARSHVVLIAGKRGSGKSYSLGVIAEELASLEEEISKNIASLIFDTMGIFWTMKFKNEKEKILLGEWNLKPKNLSVKIYIPSGFYEEYESRGIPVDEKFAIKVSELDAEDWITTFNLSMIDPISIAIERAISELKNREDFDIEDIIEELKKEQPAIAKSSISLFEAAKTWKVFSKKGEKGTEINNLISGGRTTILDLSCYSSVGAYNVRALVIGLICKKLFQERMLARKKEEIQAVQHGIDYLAFKQEREMPLVWLFLDECLTGDSEIITNKAHTPIKNIVERFERGEKFNVLGFDPEKKEYQYYPVQQVFRKGKRKICEITTETGNKIRCTPEHRALTKQGFASAFSINEIAAPLIKHYSQDKERIKARIIGHLFGEGWANEKKESLGFSGKKSPEDLNKIKKDMSLLGFSSSNIYSRKTLSRITNINRKEIVVEGTSHSIQASSKAFRYFKEFGIIYGDKATKEVHIPGWIKNSNEKIKAEFLSSLMGSDGYTIKKARNAKGDFNPIRFSFNKLKDLEKSAIEYANEIKELFNSLGIEISNISKKPGNIRKNGDETIKIVITLRKNLENTIRFLEKVGYAYCEEKEKEAVKWLSYLKARLFLKREREKIYNKAIALHKQGLGKTEIARELNFPEPQIRDWLYSNMHPGLPKTFLDFDEWIKNREQDNILFEKVFRIEEVSEEEVFDISVDKVHNFISNNFITHNCHEFLPKEGKTSASDALIQVLREGRQPGLSLVLATQQPGRIHTDVMTQSDIVISHRLTAQPDIQALNQIMQTYLLENIRMQLDNLPNLKGSALILDDNSERIYPMRIRPRFTWHGGEAPTAIKIEKRI